MKDGEFKTIKTDYHKNSVVITAEAVIDFGLGENDCKLSLVVNIGDTDDCCCDSWEYDNDETTISIGESEEDIYSTVISCAPNLRDIVDRLCERIVDDERDNYISELQDERDVAETYASLRTYGIAC